jgi:hypothetical protein
MRGRLEGISRFIPALCALSGILLLGGLWVNASIEKNLGPSSIHSGSGFSAGSWANVKGTPTQAVLLGNKQSVRAVNPTPEWLSYHANSKCVKAKTNILCTADATPQQSIKDTIVRGIVLVLVAVGCLWGLWIWVRRSSL